MKNLIIKIVSIILVSTTTLFAMHIETKKLVDEAKKQTGEMTPQHLKKLLDEGTDIILLDVREVKQRAEGQIYADEHFSITRGNLEFEVLNKIKDKKAFIVTYCRGGYKSALAAQTLIKLGYKRALNLQGGLKAWVKAGYGVDTGLGVMGLKNSY